MKEIITKKILLVPEDLEKMGLKCKKITQCRMSHSKKDDQAAYARGQNPPFDQIEITCVEEKEV